MGTLARHGIDKLTFVLPREVSSLGAWVEQLVAESTGKEGVGIIPVDGERLAAPAEYQSDRVFVYVEMAGRADPQTRLKIEALQQAGHPVIKWTLDDALDLGAEFFLWEFATAVAGSMLGINPFDQPNVQESKDNTRRLIRQYEKLSQIDEGAPALSEGPVQLFWGKELGPLPRNATIRDALARLLQGIQPGDYVALLAYVQRNQANGEALDLIRSSVRDACRAATTVGFGPRYLHSTGQLHKGGPNSGVFLQITARDPHDIPIPGERYSFSVLKRAQAAGDFQSLLDHGRRALRIHIEGSSNEGLTWLNSALQEATKRG
jgi:hypothetical protein